MEWQTQSKEKLEDRQTDGRMGEWISGWNTFLWIPVKNTPWDMMNEICSEFQLHFTLEVVGGRHRWCPPRWQEVIKSRCKDQIFAFNDCHFEQLECKPARRFDFWDLRIELHVCNRDQMDPNACYSLQFWREWVNGRLTTLLLDAFSNAERASAWCDFSRVQVGNLSRPN